jgi:hypothetical protein
MDTGHPLGLLAAGVKAVRHVARFSRFYVAYSKPQELFQFRTFGFQIVKRRGWKLIAPSTMETEHRLRSLGQHQEIKGAIRLHL